MYAWHSVIAAEDLGSSTAQKTELTRSNTAHDIYGYVLACLCSDICIYPCGRCVLFSKSPVSRSSIHYVRVHCIS
jgi:hypothetical protein